MVTRYTTAGRYFMPQSCAPKSDEITVVSFMLCLFYHNKSTRRAKNWCGSFSLRGLLREYRSLVKCTTPAYVLPSGYHKILLKNNINQPFPCDSLASREVEDGVFQSSTVWIENHCSAGRRQAFGPFRVAFSQSPATETKRAPPLALGSLGPKHPAQPAMGPHLLPTSPRPPQDTGRHSLPQMLCPGGLRKQETSRSKYIEQET